jgi:hypothetical protein
MFSSHRDTARKSGNTTAALFFGLKMDVFGKILYQRLSGSNYIGYHLMF